MLQFLIKCVSVGFHGSAGSVIPICCWLVWPGCPRPIQQLYLSIDQLHHYSLCNSHKTHFILCDLVTHRAKCVHAFIFRCVLMWTVCVIHPICAFLSDPKTHSRTLQLPRPFAVRVHSRSKNCWLANTLLCQQKTNVHLGGYNQKKYILWGWEYDSLRMCAWPSMCAFMFTYTYNTSGLSLVLRDVSIQVKVFVQTDRNFILD